MKTKKVMLFICVILSSEGNYLRSTHIVVKDKRGYLLRYNSLYHIDLQYNEKCAEEDNVQNKRCSTRLH